MGINVELGIPVELFLIIFVEGISKLQRGVAVVAEVGGTGKVAVGIPREADPGAWCAPLRLQACMERIGARARSIIVQ